MDTMHLLFKGTKILFALFGGSVWLFHAGEGGAEIYKYIDNKGIIHFTDRFESIPKEYRQQIKIIKEKPSWSTSSPAAEEREKEKEDLPRSERQKIESSPSKSGEVISPEEEKNKAWEEKEKRIAELKKQIDEKRKQQKSLRTNWMVYDRYAISRLNQEIESLEEQIKTLQRQIEEEK